MDLLARDAQLVQTVAFRMRATARQSKDKGQGAAVHASAKPERLFMPESLNRVQPSGFDGRDHPEADTDEPAKPKEMPIAHSGMCARSSLTCGILAMAMVSNWPKPMPTSPPKKHSVTDSIMNCVRMAERLAPTALRRPISRVRSETETSMMFMMPTPPTSREMPTMPPATIVTITAILLKVARALCSDWTSNVSGWPGRMLRVRRRKNFSSAWASSSVSAVLPEAIAHVKGSPSFSSVSKGDEDLVPLLAAVAEVHLRTRLDHADDAKRGVADADRLADAVMVHAQLVPQLRLDQADLADLFIVDG